MAEQNQKTVTWNEHDFPKPEKPSVGIEFFNVNSGETFIASTEALITAYYNSTNLHVNATVGQDIGWRLAPSTVAKMRRIRNDEDEVEKIAGRLRVLPEEVTDSQILFYMFQRDMRKQAEKEHEKENGYARQYEDEIRALDEKGDDKNSQSSSKPRLTKAQKKAEADAKKRQDNLEAGRDINDGIEE